MQLRRKAFEDFLSNVADETKDMFDDVLERDDDYDYDYDDYDGYDRRRRPRRGYGRSRSAAIVRPRISGGGRNRRRRERDLEDDLAVLPDQIADLSELMAALLPALKGLTAAVRAGDDMEAVTPSKSATSAKKG